MAYGVELEDGILLAVEKRVIAGLLLDLVALHLGDELQRVRELGPLAVELIDFHFAVKLVQLLVPSQEMLSQFLSQFTHLHHLDGQFLMLAHQHKLRAIIFVFLLILIKISIFIDHLLLMETQTARCRRVLCHISTICHLLISISCLISTIRILLVAVLSAWDAIISTDH